MEPRSPKRPETTQGSFVLYICVGKIVRKCNVPSFCTLWEALFEGSRGSTHRCDSRHLGFLPGRPSRERSNKRFTATQVRKTKGPCVFGRFF